MEEQILELMPDIKHIRANSEIWFCCKDLLTRLGYKCPVKAAKTNVSNENKQQLKLLAPDQQMTYNQRYTMYMNIKGVQQVLLNNNQPQATQIVEQLGITKERRYMRKEIEIITYVQEFLTTVGVPFEYQKTIGTYRIDLYMPRQKIAIEIDENGHHNRDAMYEQERTTFITKRLSCCFLRFNPDSTNFKIPVMLGVITTHLLTGE